MYIVVGLILFVCVLLILAVLAQNAKGGGLSSGFAGAGSSQLMGVKRTSDLLEQITWGLAITLIVLTLSTSFLLDMSGSGEGGINSVNVQRAQEKATAPQGIVPPAPSNNATTPATTTPAPADSTN